MPRNRVVYRIAPNRHPMIGAAAEIAQALPAMDLH
jgi:hypothetical protein